MAEIGRSFDKINQKITEYNRQIKNAKTETRLLDSALKFDTDNVDLLNKKIVSMQTSVTATTKKLVLLEEQQKQAMKQFESGEISSKQFDKINNSVTKARTELTLLENQTKSLQKTVATVGFDNLNEKLDKTKNIASSLSKIILGLGTALVTSSLAAVKNGDDLDDVSRKYQISAEQLQIQRNLYDKITQDIGGYETALSKLNSVLSSIARGRGTPYISTFEKLGVAYKDETGQVRALNDVYADLFNALANITDATERASAASIIFGDAGLNVSLVAGTNANEIARLNQELVDNGIISSEAAASAGLISDTWQNIKIQFMEVSTELMQALLPSFQIVMSFISETVIPVLKDISSWFSGIDEDGQKLILTIGIFIILLPKIIDLMKGINSIFKLFTINTYAQATATGALSAVSTPLIPIFLGIAAALTVVIGLMALFSKRARETAQSVESITNQFNDIKGQYEEIGNEIGVTTETITQSSSTKDVNLMIDLNASGDTDISDDNATKIGIAIGNEIDEILGSKL